MEMNKSALVKEIVEASIVENKPTSLPGSPLPATLICKVETLSKLNLNPSKNLFFQPPLMLGGEESVHEIIIGFVRKLERFSLDASVDCFQHI